MAQEKPKTQTQTQSRGPLLSLKPNPFFPHGPSFLSRGPVRPGPLSPLPFPIPAPSRPTPSFPLGPLLSPARSRPTTRFHSSVCSARSPSTWPKPLHCARPSFHGPTRHPPSARSARCPARPSASPRPRATPAARPGPRVRAAPFLPQRPPALSSPGISRRFPWARTPKPQPPYKWDPRPLLHPTFTP